MAKRFTDTSKWNKPFLRTLKAPYKLLWLYILDECDHAGIWQVDFDVAKLKIGERLILEDALKYLGPKIIVFDNGEKWLILDFIDFQYGELNTQNRVHASVLNLLSKYNLLDNENNIIKPLTSPLEGAKDKDKEKDKVKVKDKEIPEKIDFLNYCKTLPINFIELEFSISAKYDTWVSDGWKDGNGKNILNWKNSIRNTIPFLKPVKNGTNNATQKPINTPALLGRNRKDDES